MSWGFRSACEELTRLEHWNYANIVLMLDGPLLAQKLGHCALVGRPVAQGGSCQLSGHRATSRDQQRVVYADRHNF